MLQDAGYGVVFAGIVIVLLSMRATDVASEPHSKHDYGWEFAIAVALGIVTELLQYYQPNRQVSTMDALYDATGAPGVRADGWIRAAGPVRAARQSARALDRQEVPEMRRHRVWVAAPSGRKR